MALELQSQQPAGVVQAAPTAAGPGMAATGLKDSAAFAIPEPRIRQIARELERLLSMVQLEKDGEPVDVDGFRLRDLSQWRTFSTTTAMNALTPISSLCNSRCQFCYEEGVTYAREASLMPIHEAETRLRHFDPESGQSLFPSSRHQMEPFVHPKALDIIAMARERQPAKLFWLTTNGSFFTEDVVRRLAELKPLMFKLSLNASDPERNQRLMMTGHRTAVAIEAPRMLQRYKLPFMGSIVAWPTEPLPSVEETVRYLASFDAYAIRVRLPLTHRWLKHQLPVDFDEHWHQVSVLGTRLQRELDVPVFVEPPISWVNPVLPEVDGVVKNSPAYRAGLRPRDLIRSINGELIRTRIQSEAVLDRCHLRGDIRIEMTVERDGRELAFTLTEAPAGTDTYPYDSQSFYRGENYGVFHVEDFRLVHIQQMFDTIARHNAKSVLLFSSSIVASIFETIVQAVPEFSRRLEGIDLHIETVEENTFGGNYYMMDSRVVDDYARVVRSRIEQGVRPDLILLPHAFGSDWGIDVFGASTSDIELEFKIPVERIDWLLVYGREV